MIETTTPTEAPEETFPANNYTIRQVHDAIRAAKQFYRRRFITVHNEGRYNEQRFKCETVCSGSYQILECNEHGRNPHREDPVWYGDGLPSKKLLDRLVADAHPETTNLTIEYQAYDLDRGLPLRDRWEDAEPTGDWTQTMIEIKPEPKRLKLSGNMQALEIGADGDVVFKPTFKITYTPGPDWVEKTEFEKFADEDEAEAYCEGLRAGGARSVKWEKVIA